MDFCCICKGKSCNTCQPLHQVGNHTGAPLLKPQSEPKSNCKWFHGVRARSIRYYAFHGILSKNLLMSKGIHDSYSDSRPNTVYVTSSFTTAYSFASRRNEDQLVGYSLELPSIVFCMGPIQVLQRDRNGDNGAVEVRRKIRPEYLRIHNYQHIEGLCWPLLWVAQENGWK